MIAPEDLRAVPALVLRAPSGPSVAHVVLTIPDCADAGARALGVLATLRPCFGPQPSSNSFCSVGFSFAGLERLGLPQGYLRIFRRLAPAFTAGAALRAARCGDGFANAAERPWACLEQRRAHVLVSFHGPTGPTEALASSLAAEWLVAFQGLVAAHGGRCTGVGPPAWCGVQNGQRLGAPQHQVGEWVHFGFRDGLSEVCIDDSSPRPAAPDCRHHEPGAMLLGHVNDEGFNVFALGRATDKVRGLFRNSSFGVLRPMVQDLAAFDDAVNRWAGALTRLGGKPVTTDFVRAKLSGRWPSGLLLRPGDTNEPPQGSLKLDLTGDDQGRGCPFGSHVRRMRAAPDRYGRVFERPLQRRSIPYGPADWLGTSNDAAERGLIGHFFCASIEDQFEHLLGQWAARPPLGFEPDDSAADPLIGPHADPDATLRVPLEQQRPRYLAGFRPWTTPLGTMYAWYPSGPALTAVLQRDYEPDDKEGPWL